jgi:LmbE family N-acetylglucosaminyl deacetylase
MRTDPRAARRPLRLDVVVIAPHPDDDAIGCGGTLARLVARGARVHVVYVTDGSASHLKSKRFPPAVLRDQREREARAALERLGIRTSPLFLRAPDSGLAQLGAGARGELVGRVARWIGTARADLVLTPWPRDPHPDHVATAGIVAAALPRCGRRPTVYGYGVWLPVRGDCANRPRPHEARAAEVRLAARDVECKRAAILEHRSQTGALIDDDPDGFVIDATLLATWLAPVERFYRLGAAARGTRAW